MRKSPDGYRWDSFLLCVDQCWKGALTLTLSQAWERELSLLPRREKARMRADAQLPANLRNPLAMEDVICQLPRYSAVRPPSMTNSDPVTNDDSSEAR